MDNDYSDIKPRPLFVVGTARSGTTWLANLLLSHSQIAGVAAREHQGAHESHLYSHTLYHFPPRLSADEFFSTYQAEDYFCLTQLPLEEMCRLEGCRSVPEWFGIMMERYARGKRYWLEKTPRHAVYYRELLQDFPDARFVLIRRRFRETLLSNLKRYGSQRLPSWVRLAEKVFRYVGDLKAMTALEKAAPSACFSLDYEKLAANPEGEITRLLTWLELPQVSLQSNYPPASSFGANEEPRFSGWDWQAALAFRAVFQCLPLSFVIWIRKLHDKRQVRGFPKYALLKATADEV